MATFEGFCGPSYPTLVPAVSPNRTLNCYFESVEVPYNPKTDGALYGRPGCFPFGGLATMQAIIAAHPTLAQPVRAMLQYEGNGVLDGCTFVVSGDQFWQLNRDGFVTVWGTLSSKTGPAQIIANSSTVGQIGVIAGGNLYVLGAGIFAQVPNDGVNFFGARWGGFIDGYLIVLSVTTSLQQFQISALNDMKTWAALDVAILEGQSDPIVSLIVNVEYIYFIGSRRGEIWYNSGNQLFPFTIETGAFLEFGTDAPASLCQANARAYWIGQDARGNYVAMVAAGLTTQRISNHAVEAIWASYPTIEDAICYSWTWNGHFLIRYIFPTADKGWEYDITESARVGYPVWYEVSFTDAKGKQHAPFERAYAFPFDAGLIGSGGADGFPGYIYQLSQVITVDCAGVGGPAGLGGFPITRSRTVRLPWNNGLRNFLDRLEFFIQSGIAPEGTDPQMTLEISRDGGENFGQAISISMGKTGEYNKRLLANRLGSYRDGAIRITCTDNVFFAIVGAQHYIRKGTS